MSICFILFHLFFHFIIIIILSSSCSLLCFFLCFSFVGSDPRCLFLPALGALRQELDIPSSKLILVPFRNPIPTVSVRPGKSVTTASPYTCLPRVATDAPGHVRDRDHSRLRHEILLESSRAAAPGPVRHPTTPSAGCCCPCRAWPRLLRRSRSPCCTCLRELRRRWPCPERAGGGRASPGRGWRGS